MSDTYMKMRLRPKKQLISGIGCVQFKSFNLMEVSSTRFENFNFEVWAGQVKQQMLAALRRRSKN